MFKISARTVLELGSELISSDVIAFYELIKNGFDAGTRNGVDIRFDICLRKNDFLTLRARIAARGTDVVTLKEAIEAKLIPSASFEALSRYRFLVDSADDHAELYTALEQAQIECNSIIVSDTGSGMSVADLNKNFLVIGTASRKHDVEAALKRGESTTPYLGEKGIGRLSAMRLGDRLRVETARADETLLNLLEIDWSAFADLDAMLDEIDVKPVQGGPKQKPDWQGTRIIISDLAEDWTERRVRDMAEYDFARLTDPFVDQRDRPRIAIYWNGERLTIPWMSSELLSLAHARVVGTYSVTDGHPHLSCTLEAIDLGFPHPREVDKIEVSELDLQGAIVGEHSPIHDGALASVGPFSFELHWFNRRRLTGIDGIGDLRTVKELQERWSGVLLFRDRFRVFPYGDDEDDWLALDRRALRRTGYTLNKTQFIGRVVISRTGNPELVDQTNREGLRETPEQAVLTDVMHYVVQHVLWGFLKGVERQYKSQKIDLSEAKTQVARLEDRATTALKRLQRLVPAEGREAVEDLQQTLFEFSEFASRARARIAEVEQESRQMIEMAGVGLMVEVVAHELARASENALAALDRLQGRAVPEEIRAQIGILQAEMKSISKRVRVLDPLSISGRQRTELFNLTDLINDTVEAHDTQFKRQGIDIEVSLPDRPLRVRAVKGMVIQILENLISNSIYWLALKAEREGSFKPRIKLALHSGPPSIYYEDNGAGIAPENRENVFKPFFSLKEKAKRRGLGLFIAREAAQHHGGTLHLEEIADPDTGRLHRFVLELPESVVA